jgi:hypothetical protein
MMLTLNIFELISFVVNTFRSESSVFDRFDKCLTFSLFISLFFREWKWLSLFEILTVRNVSRIDEWIDKFASREFDYSNDDDTDDDVLSEVSNCTTSIDNDSFSIERTYVILNESFSTCWRTNISVSSFSSSFDSNSILDCYIYVTYFFRFFPRRSFVLTYVS